MRLIAGVLSVLLGLLGLVFVVGAQGQAMRIVVGAVLLVAAGALVYLSRVQPQPSQTTVVQKIDLSGDVSLESMKCRNCGAALTKDAVEVKAGAVFVHCPHCESTYQLEEEPKW